MISSGSWRGHHLTNNCLLASLMCRRCDDLWPARGDLPDGLVDCSVLLQPSPLILFLRRLMSCNWGRLRRSRRVLYVGVVGGEVEEALSRLRERDWDCSRRWMGWFGALGLLEGYV